MSAGKIFVAVSLLALAIGGATTREATAAAAGPSAAQVLYRVDTGRTVPRGDYRLRPYNIALDRIARKCTNPRMRLAEFASNTRELLRDEARIRVSSLYVLRQVNRAIPFKLGRGCADMFAAWAFLVIKG